VLFHNLIKGSATFVHYKGGGPAQMVDLIAGRVHVHPTSLQDNMALIKSGKVKPIVILNRQRLPLLPDVRTAHEQGWTDFEQPNYFGLVAPAGTNPAILGRLSLELAKIVKSPDIVKTMEAEGAILVGSTPKEFTQYIRGQVERWTRVVKENNIQLE
jgi:tripartite-type tricarboxylate transporter receptor subunit TctC